MKDLLLKEHSITTSIILHLLPGLIAGAVFFVSASFLKQNGKPLVFAYHIETFFVLLPLLIGTLIWLGKESIGNQAHLTLKEYLIYISTGLIWAVLVFILVGQFFSDLLLKKVFFFLPEWLTNIQLIPEEATHSKKTIRIAWILTLVLTSILAPIAEEVYFRGFLLPKIRYLGIWAPILSTVLFALYHFWTPWLFIVRVIAVFPMIYFSWKTGNMYIALWAHLLLNLIGDSVLTIPKVWN
ncbi:MAG: lysostaphin resistance A-like protein [Cytophagaceae bacterium]